jgi:DNA-binding LytR/AlgR family response regulator
METVTETEKLRLKSFIICRKGNAFIPVRTQDLLLIVHQSGIRFAIDNANNKYIVDQSLSYFEEILDGRSFFRVNRQVIANIHSIKEFKSLDFGKILIQLKNPAWVKNDIVVSQVNTPRFRDWVRSL